MASIPFKKPSEITCLIRHEFSGNPDELQPYLDDCKLANKYYPPALKEILFIEMIAHITKGARSDLQGRSEITMYETLRDYLQKKKKVSVYFRPTVRSTL